MPCSRTLAETRLRKRWKEQVDIYPTMANDIPLERYLAASWRHVSENDLLASYDRVPNWHPVTA